MAIIIIYYNIYYYKEIQTESSASGGVIIGSVLGVLIFSIVATIITISAILWLIKKGMYIHTSIAPRAHCNFKPIYRISAFKKC